MVFFISRYCTGLSQLFSVQTGSHHEFPKQGYEVHKANNQLV